jgi:hypothetical protein
MAGRKTVRYTMYSGSQSLLSGVATVFSVEGSGRLRQLKIKKELVSSQVVLSVYSDSGALVLFETVGLTAGIAMPYVDVTNSSLGNSGDALISGVASTTVYQPVEFSESLVVQYAVTSGSVTITGVVEIDKRLIT